MNNNGGRPTLYDLDHSPFAARVRIAARAKGAALDSVAPPGGVRSAAYRRINPIGLVPALLLEDGTVLPESEIIVEYLDERFPEPRLLPVAAADRARCRLISRVADLYLAPALKELFERTKGPADAAEVGRMIGPVRDALAVIDGLLGRGRYAMGDILTSADCALAPLLFFVERCAPLAPDAPLLGGARLGAYWEAVRRHPSVAPVLEEMAASQVRRAAARARGEPED
jgi:glutathione S-transferase